MTESSISAAEAATATHRQSKPITSYQDTRHPKNRDKAQKKHLQPSVGNLRDNGCHRQVSHDGRSCMETVAPQLADNQLVKQRARDLHPSFAPHTKMTEMHQKYSGLQHFYIVF
jgi:hypothetical protein